VSAPESVQEPLASTTANPDRSAATVDYSGLAAHPVVAAILAVTPVNPGGTGVITGYERVDEPGSGMTPPYSWCDPIWGAPEPIAAKQAAVALAYVHDYLASRDTGTCGCGCNCARLVDALADEVEAAGTDNTTRRQ